MIKPEEIKNIYIDYDHGYVVYKMIDNLYYTSDIVGYDGHWTYGLVNIHPEEHHLTPVDAFVALKRVETNLHYGTHEIDRDIIRSIIFSYVWPKDI